MLRTWWIEIIGVAEASAGARAVALAGLVGDVRAVTLRGSSVCVRLRVTADSAPGAVRCAVALWSAQPRPAPFERLSVCQAPPPIPQRIPNRRPASQPQPVGRR